MAYARDMNAVPARDELHHLVDQLDEPQAERVLRLVKTELTVPAPVRPWPESVGMGAGPADLAENADAYLAEGFGR